MTFRGGHHPAQIEHRGGTRRPLDFTFEQCALHPIPNSQCPPLWRASGSKRTSSSTPTDWYLRNFSAQAIGGASLALTISTRCAARSGVAFEAPRPPRGTAREWAARDSGVAPPRAGILRVEPRLGLSPRRRSRPTHSSPEGSTGGAHPAPSSHITARSLAPAARSASPIRDARGARCRRRRAWRRAPGRSSSLL